MNEPVCDLCEAAPLTERYHDDADCWIAECESCSVPMVVWKVHDPAPPDDLRALLHARLAAVAGARVGGEHWIDDRPRTIPDHYHAHARRRWTSP